MTLIHSIILTDLPMPQLVTVKSHRHTPAQIKATTSSLYQQLHTATSLTFNNSTFTFPLAALSLGLERGKEQSKSSSRVAVVAAGGLGSRNRKIKGEALLIPSDSRSTLNLQTNSTSPRGIPALCLPVRLQTSPVKNHLWHSDTDRWLPSLPIL